MQHCAATVEGKVYIENIQEQRTTWLAACEKQYQHRYCKVQCKLADGSCLEATVKLYRAGCPHSGQLIYMQLREVQDCALSIEDSLNSKNLEFQSFDCFAKTIHNSQ
eukprot:966886-Lingulodinium_polyedra.AAC.1